MSKVILLKSFFAALILGVFLSASLQASSDCLPEAFTAEASFLDQVRRIKATLATPDAFSRELAAFAQEIVEKVGKKISEGDERRVMFTTIQGYAEKEISEQTLSLNRLNYLVFQLAVTMNPLAKSSYNIFEGVQKVLESGLWKLSYDDAITAVKALRDAAETENKKHSFDMLIMTIFRPCDRGQWVFPLVSDNPLYGIKTYCQAFGEGISMTGFPLCAENCDVHTGLIKPGDYVLFLYHDLLHNVTLAPFVDPGLNAQHMTAIQQMVRQLIPQIDQLPVAAQGDAYLTLFWLSHELVNYKTDHPEDTYDLSKHSLQDVFKGVMDHAQKYVDKKITADLEDKDVYYRRKFLNRRAKYLLKNPGVVITEIYGVIANEDGSLDSIIVANPSDSQDVWMELKKIRNHSPQLLSRAKIRQFS